MFDIIGMGESLIDFTPSGNNEMGIPIFAQNPGGAPSNVLAQVAKLGGKTGFIGKVGKDGFGKFLKHTMQINGIDTSGLRETDECNTTLAFVQIDEYGERTFTFYRNPGADILLKPEDINYDIIGQSHIFHFGSLSLTDEPIRRTTVEAVKRAKSLGCIISYDPNYRAPLWKSKEIAKKYILHMMPEADIVKVSYEEMVFITGETDIIIGANKLLGYGAVLILISMGDKGAFYACGNKKGMVPAYKTKVVDTNGAGDSFFGAILFLLREKSLEDIKRLNDDELKKIVQFGNVAGGITVGAKGAIPAMPDFKSIQEKLKEINIDLQ